MGSVVSSIIGAGAQQNVASTQAGASTDVARIQEETSKYGIDTGAQTAAAALAEQAKESEANIAEQKYGVETGAKTAEEQLAQAASEYEQTTGAAAKNLSNATSGVEGANSKAPAELLQEKADIENKTGRTMQKIAGQTGANLATAGVRGGQAAILQNRAVGEAGIEGEENIDELLAQNAAQRQAALSNYYSGIGQTSASKL